MHTCLVQDLLARRMTPHCGRRSPWLLEVVSLAPLLTVCCAVCGAMKSSFGSLMLAYVAEPGGTPERAAEGGAVMLCNKCKHEQPEAWFYHPRDFRQILTNVQLKYCRYFCFLTVLCCLLQQSALSQEAPRHTASMHGFSSSMIHLSCR